MSHLTTTPCIISLANEMKGVLDSVLGSFNSSQLAHKLSSHKQFEELLERVKRALTEPNHTDSYVALQCFSEHESVRRGALKEVVTHSLQERCAQAPTSRPTSTQFVNI